MSARRVAGRTHCLLLHEAFSDSYRVFVLGWDSVVVEGWSACFLVGFVVVFFGKIVDFGELILTKIALPGDV
ncbi:hypothetical protein HMPREF2791_05360 [Corynebacterium sp. HMSC034A01]|nr:hypothetical protein HMPREF2791_05360 [Corynebacterium sp. HMSC034A01]